MSPITGSAAATAVPKTAITADTIDSTKFRIRINEDGDIITADGF
jgi:hypothetical protein